MSFVVIHFSDLHINETVEPKDINLVEAVLREVPYNIEDILLIISGDITESGKSSQYELATSYLIKLKDKIKNEYKIESNILAVPGNHDCNLSDDQSLRDLAINHISVNHGKIESPAILNQVIGVQDSFFKWMENFSNISDLSDFDKLCWKNEFTLSSGTRIAVICLNTAWMSTLHEKQGCLYFPINRLLTNNDADLVIALFHHPYNWLQSNNARLLNRELKANCDIVFTGHEHDPDAYSVISHINDGSHVEFIEGNIFNNSKKPEISGFNIVLFDFKKSKFDYLRYSWDGNRYISDLNRRDIPFQRNLIRGNTRKVLTDAWVNYLNNPGIPLTHRAKDIELEDIFITPDLRRFTLKGTNREIVYSDSVLNRVFDEKYLYFSGESQCGKTTLAKILFKQAIQRNLTPLYLDGSNINSPESSKISKIIKSAIKEQYKNLSLEMFQQLSKEQKVIILDNFGSIKLNRKAKGLISKWFQETYGHVFLFGDDLSNLEEFIMDYEAAKGLSEYFFYEILEFGYLLREKLVEKWFSLGRLYEFDPDEFMHQVNKTEKIIDTIIGKNLIPRYPIFLLSILQQIEAQQPLNTKTGSYGYFYEVLITAALHKTSKTPDEIDMKYTYLSEFAWNLYRNKIKELTLEELESFSSSHWQKYRLPEDWHSAISELNVSRILFSYSDGIRFSYSYVYYYFVARYMRDNFQDQIVRAAINKIVKSIHREDNANIIIFLTYLTKDKKLIYKVLSSSNEIFHDVEPCDMDKHVNFIGALQERVPQIVLPEGNVDEQRKDALRLKDKEELTEKEQSDTHEKDDDDLSEILTMNRALKSVQILGQILRNFSASLEGDIKLDLSKECFQLGLRALNVMFIYLEKRLDDVLNILIEIFDKEFEDLSKNEKETHARRFIFFLSEILCFSMIRRISLAVGSERLKPTYADLKKIFDNKATEFVQIAIQLDHYRAFPEKRVMKFFHSLKNSIFGETLLRLLVADHFYMFPRKYKLRQRICEKIGIKQKKQYIKLSAHKMHTK